MLILVTDATHLKEDGRSWNIHRQEAAHLGVGGSGQPQLPEKLLAGWPVDPHASLSAAVHPPEGTFSA